MKENYYKLNNLTIYYLLLFVCCFGFFLMFSDINKGMFVDSYVNLRMSRDINMFFNNHSSGIYNENILYPILIKIFSVIFSPKKAALFINMLFLSIGGLFFFMTVKKINDSVISALFSTVLFLINPLVLFWSLRVMPDICFMSLICVFIFCIHEKRITWSLFIFTFLILLRSEGVLLFGLFLYDKRFRDKKFLFIVGIILVIFAMFFSKSLVFNMRLAFDSISKVDIKQNFQNHILSFIYNTGVSVTIFFIFSIFYYIKLDNNKKRFYIVIYSFIIYFIMNIFWPFVQFRHWLPFLPAFFMFISEFFFFIEKGIDKEKRLKKLWLIVVIMFLYTCYGIYNTAIDRIERSSDAMKDISLAGEFSKKVKEPIFTNIPEILKWYIPQKEIHPFQDYEWLLANIEKTDDILFILSDKKFEKKIDWPDILKIEKRFEASYKYVYPCFPGNGVENSWKYLERKGKTMTSGTNVYKLDKVNFLIMFAGDAFSQKDYALSAFYHKKAVNLIEQNNIKRLNDVYSKLKITLYNQIITVKDHEKRERLIKEALNIPVLPELDDKIRGKK